ncbi:copper homeostasis periplasmic binding protein CopC [Rhizobium sp. 2YAF20]|uniref:copper homeostasis periplasmic binding protein CopC n=1 Tax=Rhizobium sp. 2YAF20 TaxID=3233027 RepID=UPI003F9CF57F
MSKFKRVFAIAAFAILGVTSQALAHAHLKSATPPMNGSVKASPSELDLTFSEGLNLKFSGVKVLGADKAAIPTGEAKLATGDDSTLVVPVTGTLASGVYTVQWHALSSDGHKTNGIYTFSIKP